MWDLNFLYIEANCEKQYQSWIHLGDIIVVGLVAIGLIAYGGSLVGFFMWGRESAGSDQGQEILTNSIIESEVNKNISSYA